MPDQLPEKVIEQDGCTLQMPSFNVNDAFIMQTSFDTTDLANREKILEIIDGDTPQMASLIGEQFQISDYVAHPVKLVDKATGELYDAIRLILVSPDGSAVSTCSPFVLESLKRIGWSQNQMPPWDPPILVKLTQKRIDKDKHVFKLTKVKSKVS